MPTIPTVAELQPRTSFDNYPTEEKLVRAALQLIPPQDNNLILDPGAGDGVWGSVIRKLYPTAEIHGVELRPIPPHPRYDRWITGNFADYQTDQRYDLVISNPPFDDWWNVEQKQLKREAKKRGEDYIRPKRPADLTFADAEVFIRRSIALTKEGGYIVFLLRLAFLASQTRGRGLWKEFSPERVYALMNRPSFIESGKTDTEEYALYIWRVGYKMTVNYTSLHWLDWR